MMDVMIGIDPHKGSHTAAMLDRGQRELRRITVRAGNRQVAELVRGGIDKEVVVTQARSLLDEVRPDDPAMVERHRQALELVDEIDRLDVVIRDSRRRITAAVVASGTTLTEIFGVGPIVAAMLIGFCGDPTRFATASRYAAYTGTAPIEFSSGGRIIHRLSRRGNRRLNH